VFDSKTNLSIYEQDVTATKGNILISSPGLNRRKVERLMELTQSKLEKGIQVTVWTLNPEGYPKSRIASTKALVSQLKKGGISVRTFPAMHEHFAILDRELVWYGSMNLLSREKEEDSMLRIKSKEIAQELIERGILNNEKNL
jgi:hypothetical protein